MRLTRIRLQSAIYFRLHRGSLLENTAGGQPRFRRALSPAPKISVKTICHIKGSEGFAAECIPLPQGGKDICAAGRPTRLWARSGCWARPDRWSRPCRWRRSGRGCSCSGYSSRWRSYRCGRGRGSSSSRGSSCWRWSLSYTWSCCWTSSHIQERRTDRPPGLEALKVVHAASAHEDNVAAYRQADSVYGCIDGDGRRIERAVHWDGRAASPRRRVNIIFCCAYVLAECVV